MPIHVPKKYKVKCLEVKNTMHPMFTIPISTQMVEKEKYF